MFVYAAIPLTCWVCALIAIPRKPRFGNEAEELAYFRLLGRQRTLALIALCITAVVFIVGVLSLPQRLDPDLHAVRQARVACAASRASALDGLDYGIIITSRCYEFQPGGTWAERLEKPDGSWVIVATMTSPPSFVSSSPAPRST
jgi:hypothetical protein